MANYGPQAVESATDWSIADAQGREIARGSLPSKRLETGRTTVTGKFQAALGSVSAPARLTVRVGLTREKTVENTWSIWVYPAQHPPAPTTETPVRVAHALDDDARKALAAGGRVLLFTSPKDRQNAVTGSFMPVFWNTRLFHKQPGHAGPLVRPQTPGAGGFPTEAHSDWQWADLLGRFSAADSLQCAGAPPSAYQPMEEAAHDVSDRSKAVILDHTPPGFRPIVQVIDNEGRNHKLGAIFEAKVGAAACWSARWTWKSTRTNARRPGNSTAACWTTRAAHVPTHAGVSCRRSGRFVEMTIIARRTLRVVALLLAGTTARAQTPPAPTPAPYSEQTLADLTRLQQAALRGDYAYRQVAHLSDNIGPRLSGSPQAQKAVEYVAAELARSAWK